MKKKVLKVGIQFIIAISVVSSVSLLSAQTVEVDPCNGGNTMQEAIDEVITNDAPNQTILVNESYFTNQAPGGDWGLSTLAGNGNLTGLTIDGQGSYIESEAAGLGFFDISNVDNLTIKNFTLDGFNRSIGSLDVNNCEGTLIENVRFVNSPSTQPMVINSASGNTSVTFKDCFFGGNPLNSDAPSENPNTGAVQIVGDQTNTLDVVFDNTIFRCNARQVDGGGAVQIVGDGDAATRDITTVTFNDCLFANNFSAASGQGGGAIYVTNTVTLNVNNTTFYNNDVRTSNNTAGGGGAIHAFSSVDLTVDGCTFENNSAFGDSGAPDGGAISVNASGASNKNNVIIKNSIFTNNACKDEGGAIFLRHVSSGSNNAVTNCLFLNNNAPDGGVLHVENGGQFTFDSLTITSNTGKGFENNSGLGTFSNSINVSNGSASTYGSLTQTNNTTSGSVTHTDPMSGGDTDPSGNNYDVAGNQGSKNGVIPDLTGGDDGSCASTSTGSVAPPTGLNPCDTISGTTVPVELVSFVSRVDKNCNIILEWMTASEKNNDQFEIERSLNGKDFNAIGSVNGNGTTTETQTYSYLINNEKESVSYYRLKQVDFDGQYEYSSIVSAKKDCGNQSTIELNIHPNPTSSQVIKLSANSTNKGVFSYVVTNLIGQVVSKDVFEVEVGQNQLTIEIDNMDNGIYFIVVKDEVLNTVYTNKIVKK